MAHYRKKDDVIHKTGSTQRIAMTPEEDQAMAIGYTHKKFGKDRACSSGDILVDKHTHTDILITILNNHSSERSNNEHILQLLFLHCHGELAPDSLTKPTHSMTPLTNMPCLQYERNKINKVLNHKLETIRSMNCCNTGRMPKIHICVHTTAYQCHI